MRLLMTTDTVGGVWTFTSELACELLRLGCQVALVSFGRLPSPSQQASVDTLTASYPANFHFTASAAALEWMPANSGAYRDGADVLLSLCKSFVPNVLLLSQFCYGALPVNVPKVVVAHSDVLSWADAVGKAPLTEDLWLRTYRELVQTGLDGADVVVAPTQVMLDDLRRNFRVSTNASVIANGIALPAPVMSERKLQAVTAGRLWDEAKNLQLLADVVPPMPILIAGEQGGKDMTLPAQSQTHLLGALSHDELLRVFAESAVYTCTSCYEPFGLAALEAALHGCAVLCNDIPSLREVWADAAVYFTDAASLSALLQELADNAQMLALAQARSAARAQTYTAKRMANRYLHLAQELLDKAKQHTPAAALAVAESEPAHAA